MSTAAESVSARSEIVKKFQVNSTDTGSPEVQVALLTSRIETLTRHSSGHPNDVHSNRGMLALVSKRKKILQYLRTENVGRYKALIAALGLRK
jgi:small subunit ribosomal protein S15